MLDTTNLCLFMDMDGLRHGVWRGRSDMISLLARQTLSLVSIIGTPLHVRENKLGR